MRGQNACRLAGYGLVWGLPAFAMVLLAAPLESPPLFCCGAALIGFGGGQFSVGTLTAAMGLDAEGRSGLALGAWGAMQAAGAGVAISLAGVLRDVVSMLALHGGLGATLTSNATGYGVVYYIEIVLLFASLIVIGPLSRHSGEKYLVRSDDLGLARLPT